MTFAVHYHKTTGEISNWGTDDGSEESFRGAEYGIARFEEWQAIDPYAQRIDPDTLTIIAKEQAT